MHACLLVASDSFLVIQFDPNTMEFSTCCDFYLFIYFFSRAVILICLWVVVVSGFTFAVCNDI